MRGKTLPAVTALRAAMARAVAGGTSLRELARRSKVDSGSVSRFYKGERTLTVVSAAKLCQVLGLELVARGAGGKS